MRDLTKLVMAALAFSWGANADDQENVLEYLESHYSATAGVAEQLWNYSELGYLEEKSSHLLQATLREAGFKVTPAVAGMPTAFVAEFGAGGPVVGIIAEFDALPGLSQVASPVKEMRADVSSGHGCGHNLFGAGSVSAAIAVQNWLKETGRPGRIRVYGTPAEEGGSGKVYMVREGLFKDVDTVLHWHPSDKNTAEATSSLANRSAKFRFYGEASHAARSPWSGRSALDGVEAMNMMANLMREHIPPEARIHYVITAGGMAPNVVPEFAEVFYYFRHPSTNVLNKLWERLEAAARGAAEGTGTRVEWETIHGNHPLLINETLARVVDKNLRRVGGVEYSAKEQEFATEISKTLGDLARPHGNAMRIEEFKVQPIGSGGSTDVGDVSVVVPTVGLRVATWVPGTTAHSWQSVATSGMSIGYRGAHVASKVMAATAVELFLDEELRNRAREEFQRRRGADFEYEPLLGDREPPLNYRGDGGR